jgi:hypothetical protein
LQVQLRLVARLVWLERLAIRPDMKAHRDNNHWRRRRNTRTAALAVHWFDEATAAPQLSLSEHRHKDRGMDKLVENRKTILRLLSTTIQIGLHAAFAANFLRAIIDNHGDQSAENPHAKDL